MNQETLVKPEPYVKVCMALAAFSLVTIAICQVVLVVRPSSQPKMRRSAMPMENRVMPQEQPPFSPGMMPPGVQQGQTMPEGWMQRPPPPPDQGQNQPGKK